MKKLTIDESYLCSVTEHKSWSIYKGATELTEDDLVKILKGTDRCSSISSHDHPEFAKIRELLGEEGYISIQRNCWNGDRVLRTFSLNGAKFKKGEQFPCAAAIKFTLKSKIKSI